MAVRDYDSLVSEAAFRLRLDTATSATLLAAVQGWANDVIQDMHGRHDWYWTLARQIVQTVIDKTAGTVSVSASGTSVTGVGTAFSSSDVGSFIRFEGSTDWYKVLTTPTTLSLTIEAGYAGTSALSAGTYTLRKVFYSIPSAEKVLSAKQATSGELICINHKDFDTFLSFGDGTGPGKRYCVFGIDSSGYLQFNIYPHADVAYNLEVKYKKAATQDSVTDIPPKWRGVYLDGILARGLEYVALGQPEFDRKAIRDKQADYERGIARMLTDAEPESDYHPILRNPDVQTSPIGNHLPQGLSIPQD